MTFAGIGEAAALGTAACWACTSVWFSAAGVRVGSLVVNLLRMPIAFAWFAAWGLLVRGEVFPVDTSLHAWIWLSISGLVGFAFGDLCLFRALVLIGPRLASLLMATAPPLTAIVGWLVLDERLSSIAMLGMLLTTAGIAWTIAVRNAEVDPVVAHVPHDRAERRRFALGVVLALGGALGQGGGLVLSKYGMGGDDPFASSQIRVLAGALGFAAILTVMRRWPAVVRAFSDRPAMLRLGLGATFGPFLGVALSLVAVQHTETGIAASLLATAPILVIPLAVRFGGERVGTSALLGTVLAVIGVVLLVGPGAVGER
ncbi:MAG TPA: DMT family transporter [Nannocystaceae bacterium]|nr:DMT family transporter [Nannocystaceae bacterium]